MVRLLAEFMFRCFFFCFLCSLELFVRNKFVWLLFVLLVCYYCCCLTICILLLFFCSVFNANFLCFWLIFLMDCLSVYLARFYIPWDCNSLNYFGFFFLYFSYIFLVVASSSSVWVPLSVLFVCLLVFQLLVVVYSLLRVCLYL